MGTFRALGRKVLDDAASCCGHLMYGIKPSVRLEDMRDEMSNQAAGYSFVQDPIKELGSAYLDLSAKACLSPLDGLMSHDRWSMPAVNAYLKKERELLCQIMLLMYLLGGQAPRSTELFSLECQNGPSSSRGIYVHGGHMTFVTRHHKARHATNHEFQIARFLPHEAGHVLFLYLVYIRPFAEMVRRVCFGQTGGGNKRLLFSSPGIADVPWTSVNLSKSLREYTGTALGTPIGVQAYRQLSIAITEKHVRELSRPFNRFDDKACSADIEVAFAWQSGHRPLQRGTTYGLDGAYPDSLQPALLRVYQWASGQWHTFLGCEQHVFIPEQPVAPLATCMQHIEGMAPENDRVAKRKIDATDASRLEQPKRNCVGSDWNLALSTQLLAKQPITKNVEQGNECVHGISKQVNQTSVLPQHGSMSKCGQVAYLADYKVAVCIPCGYCINPPPSAKRHFRDTHSNWPRNTRNDLIRYVDELCLIAPDRLVYPPKDKGRVRWLPVYDGWGCLRCEYLCVSEAVMEKHGREVHRWTKGHSRPWRAAQVQTFFSGPHRRFFEIEHGRED